MSEDKCEGVGAWSRDEYYLWLTEYLRWLWYQPDPSLAGLVLQHVESVVRYDAEVAALILAYVIFDVDLCFFVAWNQRVYEP